MNLDIAHFKSQLKALRNEVLETIALAKGSAKTVELDQNRVGRLSRMDALQGQAMAQASAARQKQSLSLIDAALERIDHGDYGRCLQCDQFIPEGRLEIDPTAQYCVHCAAKSEPNSW